MPSINVNFADVESFDPLPEGEYDVEIEKVEVRRNKADDGDYLNWEMVVIDGEYENRRLWMITSLKPKALFRLKQILEDLYILDGDDIELEYDDDVEVSQQSGPLLIEPDLEGLAAIAYVKNEMYDGKERNRVEALVGEKPKPKVKKTSNRNSQPERRTRDNDAKPAARRRLR